MTLTRRIFHSRPFAILAIVIAASATAYRVVERQQRLRDQENKIRIKNEVLQSIDQLKIEQMMKPLSEAAQDSGPSTVVNEER